MVKHAYFVVFVLTALPAALASDWPQWRGPFFNGTTDERNLPSQWSQTENIAWSVDLPGVAASTPIVSGNRVFLSGVDAQRDMLLATCYDRATGKLLWSHDVGQGTHRDTRSNYASDSPATDGKIVVFFYGTGQLLAFDVEGTLRWQRDIQKDEGPFAFNWTFSSSPLLYDGKLYIQVLQRDVAVSGRGRTDGKNDSYLLIIDPTTGKNLKKVLRRSDAIAESREAFTTPIPGELNKRPMLFLAGGDALSAHDPATGEELWRWGEWNPTRVPHWRLVPSPVVGEGVVLLCAPKGEPLYAVLPQGKKKAAGKRVAAGDSRLIAWKSKSKDITSDVPTPAFFSRDFFVLSDVRKVLSRVESQTGQVKWATPTPGRAKYEASPLVADNKIYTINFDGQVAIFHAATGDLLRTIPMDKPATGEVVRASIVAAGGQLFIRTTRKLYCVGKTN